MTDTMNFPAIPFFAGLREAVLERSTKRMPIWRFRLAPDMLAQIQPKPAHMLTPRAIAHGIRQIRIRFECRVVLSDGADAAMLERTPDTDQPWWRMKFDITDLSGETWELRRTSWSWGKEASLSGIATLAARLHDALAGGFFDQLSGDEMLAPKCLICGKGLTDPASMARFIGPECSGSSSLRIPHLFTARAA